MEIESFRLQCEKRHCLRKSFISKQCKKKDKQQKCYDKFIAKQKRNDPDIDFEWMELTKRVWERDKASCRVNRILDLEEKKIVKDDGFLSNLDCAHVFGKGAYPHLKYDIDNIVLMSRLFHSRLDTGRHPVSAQPIDAFQKEQWWMRIVGKENYNKLLIKARKTK